MSAVPAPDAATLLFSTWSAKNQHLVAMSIHTEHGYRGQSLCGQDIYDQGELDSAYARCGSWVKPPPRFVDLRLCTKCKRKANR